METHPHKMLYSQIPCQVELHLLQTHFLLMEFLKVGHPSNGVNIGTITAGTTVTVSFQVTVTSLPTENPIVNFSSTSYQLVSPPDSETSISNPVSTQIKEAILSMTKNESVSFAISGKLLFILLLLPM